MDSNVSWDLEDSNFELPNNAQTTDQKKGGIPWTFTNLEHMAYILGGYDWSVEHEIVMKMNEKRRESEKLTKYAWNAFIDRQEY